MIRARSYLLLTALLVILLLALLGRGELRARAFAESGAPALARLAGQLGLTDLALWTEARYTRHPSQADLFAAFQDAPGSFDHFPAGSIIAPHPLPKTP